MKLTGVVRIQECYGAIFNMEEKLLPVSGNRRQYFTDRKLTLSGVATRWHQTTNSKASGDAGALHEKRMRAVVTGGGGYFGYKLGCALAKAGASVVLYDIHKPIWEVPNGVVCIQADVRDYDAIFAACEGADCVFHVASYGMSGREQLHREEIETININGTRFVIDACKQRNIARLIYTSTVNVVFGGLPIEDGDEETVPYFPIEKHVDHYSRTKSIAEQMVLAANGTPLAGGGILYTCVLRPPGIYGPEEQRHLPRLAKNIERGLLSFKFGDPYATMNWVHAENLVQAQILAADALTPKKNYIASGQVYFINDGEKFNLFEWLTPLFERLGCSKPRIRIPTSLVYASAMIMEYLHLMLKPFVELSPLLTRNEVQNISITHTFRIDKARSQLGYSPEKFTFADSVDHYIKTRPEAQNHHIFLKVLLTLIVSVSLIILSLKCDGLSVLHFFKETQH
ncbi:PREDICTED: putative short-chain dehydrogenase/reductase family 42E member 2 [Calidris pugnax]|uniref:putative short-chain dehydrogenase/reductase family 42E member 2 n=1 Tax=Calidris pugnax TaxID=198806 RepID=UPI00071E5A82|nr:PREDICTED: putative short-chain dehydrogenase/reductase family 42E member 2 [Calidris pugnax]XP_014806858.1 PREDICTED: putative short-chain dehydrogenase/reductase family 42E member 2 [Calidris pugnax]XP_014806859.1 PREDICTED: putative short-chain dehydrogenase/reductase family 42E member 2 [Calidris pugnax]XP_014806860.1 PREDICTED: putative short-chain dehydrogenase/reductase family 42E member 2 [Calidris pugnax]